MAEHQTADLSILRMTDADYVSVPKSDKYVRPEFMGRPDERMILLRRHASLLASGGEIDLDRGYIKGGDRTCTLLPDGTRPLSAAEIKIVKARHASLPVKDQTP